MTDSGSNSYDGTHNKAVVGNSLVEYIGDVSSYSSMLPGLNTGGFDGSNCSVFAKIKTDSWEAGFEAFLAINVDVSNQLHFRKSSATSITYSFSVGGAGWTPNTTPPTDDTPFVMGFTMTPNGSDTDVQAFYNGSSVLSATRTGQWSGSLTNADVGKYFSVYPLINSSIDDVIVSYGATCDATEANTISTKLNAGTLTTADLDTIFGSGIGHGIR